MTHRMRRRAMHLCIYLDHRRNSSDNANDDCEFEHRSLPVLWTREYDRHNNENIPCDSINLKIRSPSLNLFLKTKFIENFHFHRNKPNSWWQREQWSFPLTVGRCASAIGDFLKKNHEINDENRSDTNVRSRGWCDWDRRWGREGRRSSSSM